MQSNKDLAKKEREHRHFEWFRQNYSDYPPDGVIDCQHTEKPDFLIKTPRGPLGIELTAYPHSDSYEQARKQKQQEAEWEKAVANACRQYAAQNLPYVDVGVIWNSHYNLPSSRRKSLEEQIFELVKTHVPDLGCTKAIKHSRSKQLPDEIHSIRIGRFDFLTKNHWAVHHSGWMRSLEPPDLDVIIQRKEPKVSSYRILAAELWLVIVIEGMRASSFAELSTAAMQYEYSSDFDKIFVLHCFEGRVTELFRQAIGEEFSLIN